MVADTPSPSLGVRGPQSCAQLCRGVGDCQQTMLVRSPQNKISPIFFFLTKSFFANVKVSTLHPKLNTCARSSTSFPNPYVPLLSVAELSDGSAHTNPVPACEKDLSLPSHKCITYQSLRTSYPDYNGKLFLPHGDKKREGGWYIFFKTSLSRINSDRMFPPSLTCLKTDFPAAAMLVNKRSVCDGSTKTGACTGKCWEMVRFFLQGCQKKKKKKKG